MQLLQHVEEESHVDVSVDTGMYVFTIQLIVDATLHAEAPDVGGLNRNEISVDMQVELHQRDEKENVTNWLDEKPSIENILLSTDSAQISDMHGKDYSLLLTLARAAISSKDEQIALLKQNADLKHTAHVAKYKYNLAVRGVNPIIIDESIKDGDDVNTSSGADISDGIFDAEEIFQLSPIWKWE